MGYQLFFRSAMLIIFAATIFAGMVFDQLTLKACAAIFGATSVGFLGACRIRFFREQDTKIMRQLSENVRESRKLLRDSSFGVYRRTMWGTSFDDAFGNLDVLDTFMDPLFIFTVFSVATMMLFTPEFGEFLLSSDANRALALKSFGVHSLIFLLLASGWFGIALRLLFIVKPNDR